MAIVFVGHQNLFCPINRCIDVNHGQPAKLAEIQEADVVHLANLCRGTETIRSVSDDAPLQRWQAALILVTHNHHGAFCHEGIDHFHAHRDLVSHVQNLV